MEVGARLELKNINGMVLRMSFIALQKIWIYKWLKFVDIHSNLVINENY